MRCRGEWGGAPDGSRRYRCRCREALRSAPEEGARGLLSKTFYLFSMTSQLIAFSIIR